MRQNNPLLYIFVGMPDGSALETVRDIQTRRADTRGVGYLSVGEYTKDGLLSEIREEQSRFLTKVYVTSGEIKVVYVVNADSRTALELSVIKHDVDTYLQYLYPGGILTDIFLLLDEAHELGPSARRGAVIELLSGMHGDSCMLYILSNVNSRKLYEADALSRMLHSVALLGLMKDYVSRQTTEQLNRWYNERFFKEDCYRTGGCFLTVGYLCIRRPVEIIKKLMLIELLTCRKPAREPECGFTWSAEGISRERWVRMRENLYGLAINAQLDPDALEGNTNGQALRLLFGDRLDRFFEANLDAGYMSDGAAQVRTFLQGCARNPAQGFYYIHAITAREGALRRYLDKLLAGAQAAQAQLEARASGWGNERFSRGKRRLGPPRVPEDIYNLAAEYLEPRFESIQPELEQRRITAAIEYVDNIHKLFSKNYAAVMQLVDGLRAEVESLRSSEELSFGGDEYYVGLLREIVGTDKQFDALYSRMWRCFEKGLDMYVAELEGYIGDALRTHSAFKQSVLSDLASNYDGALSREFYEQIRDYIIENKHFNILLKSGCKSLYSEINVFMDASGQAARWGGATKMNFFYGDNSDAIEVVYHAGAFSGADLYYEALYSVKES